LGEKFHRRKELSEKKKRIEDEGRKTSTIAKTEFRNLYEGAKVTEERSISRTVFGLKKKSSEVR